jgi:hypothetical protein
MGKKARQGDLSFIQTELRGNPAREAGADLLKKPRFENTGLLARIALVQRLQGGLHDDLAFQYDGLAEFAIDLDFLLQDVRQTVKERPKGSFEC